MDVVGRFSIRDRSSGDMVPAVLVKPLGADHVRDYLEQWHPAFETREKQLKEGESLASAQLQDAHWRWPEKVLAFSGQLGFASFALTAAGCTQGMMFVNLMKSARLSDQKGKSLVYVELIATAPWNRSGLCSAARFKGVGRILIAAAVSLSFEEEFGGRIGLHSLPQAATWYRDIGMTDMGADVGHQGMHYFEMTEVQARQFLSPPLKKAVP